MGIHARRGRRARRRLPRHRGPPGGAGRRGRPRRPGARLGGDPGAGRRAATGSRSATSASTASRTSSAPSACSSWRRRGSRPTSRRRGPRTPGRRATCRPQLTSFVGAGGGRAGVGAARADAAADPHRAGRDRQDAAVDPARGRVPRAVRRRRVVRAARGGHGSRARSRRRSPPRSGCWRRTGCRSSVRPRAPRDRARSCSCSTTSSRSSKAAPIVADLLRGGPGADGHRVQPGAAPDRRRAGVPGPAAGAARRRRRPPATRSRGPRRCGCSSSGRMAVRPDFALTAENAAAVAAIVRRLDGLPLAIELAAARVRLLAPAAIARAARRPAGAAVGGGRDLPERQRTLRGAIDWSHDLLDADEPAAVRAARRCSRGGARCEPPRRSAAPGRRRRVDVLDGLETLVGAEPPADRRRRRTATARFAMLETIREYAAERLAAAGEPRRAARPPRRGVPRARRGGAPHRRRRPRHWLDRMEDEHDNLRAAFEYLLEIGDHERVSRLVAAAWRFWHMRGHIVEGRRRDRARAGDARPARGRLAARLRALEAAGGLAYWGGDLSGGRRAVRRGRGRGPAAGRRGRDRQRAVQPVLRARGDGRPAEVWRQGLTTERARSSTRRSRSGPRLGDERGIARGLWGLGEYHTYRGEFAEAEVVLTRSPRGLRAAPRPVLDRLGPVHPCRSRACRARGHPSPRRPTSPARCARSRRRAYAPASCSGWPACPPALLATGREEAAYQVAGPRPHGSVQETGLRLALLGPSTDGSPGPRSATRPIPAPGGAAAVGQSMVAVGGARSHGRPRRGDHGGPAVGGEADRADRPGGIAEGRRPGT